MLLGRTFEACESQTVRCLIVRGGDVVIFVVMQDSDTQREYHDKEWGKPSHDDRHLFEMLILEGF